MNYENNPKTSLKVTKITSPINSRKPRVCATCSYFKPLCLPKILPIVKKTSLPPSSAGMGKMFRMAKFNDSKAVN